MSSRNPSSSALACTTQDLMHRDTDFSTFGVFSFEASSLRVPQAIALQTTLDLLLSARTLIDGLLKSPSEAVLKELFFRLHQYIDQRQSFVTDFPQRIHIGDPDGKRILSLEEDFRLLVKNHTLLTTAIKQKTLNLLGDGWNPSSSTKQARSSFEYDIGFKGHSDAFKLDIVDLHRLSYAVHFDLVIPGSSGKHETNIRLGFSFVEIKDGFNDRFKAYAPPTKYYDRPSTYRPLGMVIEKNPKFSHLLIAHPSSQVAFIMSGPTNMDHDFVNDVTLRVTNMSSETLLIPNGTPIFYIYFIKCNGKFRWDSFKLPLSSLNFFPIIVAPKQEAVEISDIINIANADKLAYIKWCEVFGTKNPVVFDTYKQIMTERFRLYETSSSSIDGTGSIWKRCHIFKGVDLQTISMPPAPPSIIQLPDYETEFKDKKRSYDKLTYIAKHFKKTSEMIDNLSDYLQTMINDSKTFCKDYLNESDSDSFDSDAASIANDSDPEVNTDPELLISQMD